MWWLSLAEQARALLFLEFGRLALVEALRGVKWGARGLALIVSIEHVEVCTGSVIVAASDSSRIKAGTVRRLPS